MAAYVYCKTCSGRGTAECNFCPCKSCKAFGKTTCFSCKNGSGSVACDFCNSSGLIDKKGFIFTRKEKCPKCAGKGQVACTICKGSRIAVCSTCNGKGVMDKCSSCNGSRKVKCQVCSGKGNFESEWLKSIKNLPVERLRFEYQKRQHEMERLERKKNKLSEEYEELSEWVSDDSDSKPWKYKDEDDYPMGLRSIPEDMDRLDSEIIELEVEMDAIDEIIEKRWK